MIIHKILSSLGCSFGTKPFHMPISSVFFTARARNKKIFHKPPVCIYAASTSNFETQSKPCIMYVQGISNITVLNIL